ncbi:hypothetical protein BJB45_18170 [Halomonas huangheensis]|uniref:Uncharacterized protein n=1 Tax=Halomonas huangheensis TaxID=1178482 RepID=W1NDC1_9GAMM|nr:hypothetical protein BJB45_18170 [Halomonas huangheensis]
MYQAELLLGIEAGDDEHREARRCASEEGALALLELALDALLRDVSTHAQLDSRHWRDLLLGDDDDNVIAELQRLRSLAADPESWLGWLLTRLNALHGDEGAGSKRGAVNAQLISSSHSAAPLDEQLRRCIRAARDEIAALRETSEEW